MGHHNAPGYQQSQGVLPTLSGLPVFLSIDNITLKLLPCMQMWEQSNLTCSCFLWLSSFLLVGWPVFTNKCRRQAPQAGSHRVTPSLGNDPTKRHVSSCLLPGAGNELVPKAAAWVGVTDDSVSPLPQANPKAGR